MQNLSSPYFAFCRYLRFSVSMGLFFCHMHPVLADNVQNYARQPMASNASEMDDPLLVFKKFEPPVWSLHNTLGLPDWLTVNVDQRTRYESMDGTFKAGTKGGDQQIPLQTALWLQAKLGAFRISTEFIDSRAVGADQGSGVNNNQVNTADFVQGFVSWANQSVFDSNIGTEVRVGRQTMELGSRRLVARPLFRNTMTSFTGVRLRLLERDNWRFNGFVTLPVLRFPNTSAAILNGTQQFDQEATRTWFSGGFLEFFNLGWGINSEVYLYNLDEADSFNNPTRKRRYFTPGFRLLNNPAKGRLDFQAEIMGQFGTVRATTTSNQDLQHQAWSQHINLGYTFDLPWTPRFALEYDYASGNHNPNAPGTTSDHRFDPLYGGAVQDFGPTGIYGPFSRSNINTPGYRLQLSPRHDVQLTVQQRLFWLASASDCWGGAACYNSSNLLPSKNSGSFIGDQLGFQARYDFNSSLNLEAGWFRLFKGQFAKQATNAPAGQDVDYFYVQSQLRF
jgi:hypothetical protein